MILRSRARKIAEVLDKPGVQHKHAVNGLEAWTRLEGMAAMQQTGRDLKRRARPDPCRRRDARNGRLCADRNIRTTPASMAFP